ncbi:MAG: hypothetical protein KGH65_03795 [Candidatus Micrarchaeota archaeon]|nr:hypothetical protein [Candidatus Micrarchaeota archaeon]
MSIKSEMDIAALRRDVDMLTQTVNKQSDFMRQMAEQLDSLLGRSDKTDKRRKSK